MNIFDNNDDFLLWYQNNYDKLNEKHIPKIRHLVYIEQIISGVGVQTDREIFQEYIDAWRKSDRLKIKYNLDLDCNEYFIDDVLVFRKYDYGCIV